MKIIGCDFHPSFQQIAICDLETGEFQERKLSHSDGQAERFYRELGEPALIGIEATGNSQWFLDLVQRLGHEIRVGDAAKIRASYVRKQSTDKRDAGHILKLLLEKRFPQLWTPSAAVRDQRQLLRHRDKLVEIRTKVKGFSGERAGLKFVDGVAFTADPAAAELAGNLGYSVSEGTKARRREGTE